MKLIPVMDGVEQNRLYPDTFPIPTRMDKDRIKPGDFVKAGFLGEGNMSTERLWVLVTEVDAGTIRGTLANEPVMVSAKFGDLVEMEFRHIIEIQEEI